MACSATTRANSTTRYWINLSRLAGIQATTSTSERDAARVPELLPVRYGRMLQSPFTFYRGAREWQSLSGKCVFRPGHSS
jgi:Uncharacterized protein conserved in bacteria (DUF2252)